MKGIIIHQGKYGTTDQYANWLAKALSLPMIRVDIANPAALAEYELIILGSPVYVGELVIKKWLKRNVDFLSKRKVVLFIVSGTTAHDQLLQRQVLDNNLEPALRDVTQVFFLPGRCIISELSWKDRIVLKMGAWLEKDPKKKMVMETGFNEVDKSALEPVITTADAMLRLSVPV